MRTAFVTLLVLLVSACGSSESPPPPVESTPSAEPAGASESERPDGRRVVVVFGDSLTSGFGVIPSESYPYFLQQEIDRRGLPFRVVNEGVSGDTTDMGLARLQMVTARSPQFVILAFGGNDGLRALPVEGMKENLRQMIVDLKRSGATVVLAGMMLPPNYGREYTEAFADAYVTLAKETDVALVPFLLEGVGGYPDMMQDDGIHPTPAGNRRVARNVFDVLGPLLEEAARTSAAAESEPPTPSE